MDDSGNAKLSDYAFSNVLKITKANPYKLHFNGVTYQAPAGVKDQSSDVYCLGLIGLELILAGNPTANNEDFPKLVLKCVGPASERPSPKSLIAAFDRLVAKSAASKS